MNRFYFSLILLCIFGFSLSRANAHFVVRSVSLTGPGGGFGSGLVELDLDLVQMRVQLNFNNLSSNTTGAFLFANPKPNQPAQAALPSFTGFPTGVTSGTYTRTFDLTVAQTYDGAFLAAADTGLGQTVVDALKALHDSAEDETAFIRITTASFPGGAISGHLSAVPEPSSLALVGILGSGFALFQMRKRWLFK